MQPRDMSKVKMSEKDKGDLKNLLAGAIARMKTKMGDETDSDSGSDSEEDW